MAVRPAPDHVGRPVVGPVVDDHDLPRTGVGLGRQGVELVDHGGGRVPRRQHDGDQPGWRSVRVVGRHDGMFAASAERCPIRQRRDLQRGAGRSPPRRPGRARAPPGLGGRPTRCWWCSTVRIGSPSDAASSSARTEGPSLDDGPPLRIAEVEALGISRARNCGTRLATGDVIVSLDDDARPLAGVARRRGGRRSPGTRTSPPPAGPSSSAGRPADRRAGSSPAWPRYWSQLLPIDDPADAPTGDARLRGQPGDATGRGGGGRRLRRAPRAGRHPRRHRRGERPARASGPRRPLDRVGRRRPGRPPRAPRPGSDVLVGPPGLRTGPHRPGAALDVRDLVAAGHQRLAVARPTRSAARRRRGGARSPRTWPAGPAFSAEPAGGSIRVGEADATGGGHHVGEGVLLEQPRASRAPWWRPPPASSAAACAPGCAAG